MAGTEADKVRMRALIQFQINQLNTTLTQVNAQISNLTTEQTNLGTYLGEWNAQKSRYNGNDILSDVVIVNVFEGVCADKIKENMEECISEMDQTYSGVNGLKSNVGRQISRLNQYVLDINAKLTTLKAQLNSL